MKNEIVTKIVAKFPKRQRQQDILNKVNHQEQDTEMNRSENNHK